MDRLLINEVTEIWDVLWYQRACVQVTFTSQQGRSARCWQFGHKESSCHVLLAGTGGQRSLVMNHLTSPLQVGVLPPHVIMRRVSTIRYFERERHHIRITPITAHYYSCPFRYSCRQYRTAPKVYPRRVGTEKGTVCVGWGTTQGMYPWRRGTTVLWKPAGRLGVRNFVEEIL